MRKLDGKIVHVGGKEMALLHQSYSGRIRVEPLPACSLGTYLKIVNWVRDLGYDAR